MPFLEMSIICNKGLQKKDTHRQ